MRQHSAFKVVGLHLAVIVLFFLAQFVLPEYHHLAVTRVMILAIFALGYNLLFGYTGLLSLGHALFFAAGLYGAGLTAFHLGWSVPAAFAAGVGAGFFASLVIGVVALRTSGVAFMIVTMMFSQVAYLASLYFTTYTRGEEGLVMPEAARHFDLFGVTFSLTDPSLRYNIALLLLAVTLIVILIVVRGPMGRVLIAIRENEPRTLMLGYNTFLIKLKAFVISGTISSVAGAAYALLFAYVGSSFASIQYSIEALLFTLLGGAGTVLGPILGTFAMFYLIDIVSGFTVAYLLVTGIALIALVLFFPKGILGTIRERWMTWLP
ncbi:branched-chain amino acid ABC transporter permease [Metarhizobium album]|uniref:Branched-chain amino acid ABC transporter permease n=1 Tax=Metarhizobium album TaxID=2182425 RepID=A0A2U2DRA7_9HYPH|nr:branched-chain amino acid ABC transporter permease [Rhizobium album]PWE55759.1 branched-chain amino acid ABC transporter permease [Rhizobium album]